jgi:hypothetical protein
MLRMMLTTMKVAPDKPNDPQKVPPIRGNFSAAGFGKMP